MATAAASAASAAAAPAPVDVTLKNPDVVSKYKTAAEITNRALKLVADACVAGARVLDLCVAGDKCITEGASGVFRKNKEGEKIERGIAFPTCVSINNCACHFSPLSTEAETTLSAGDLVKIELGTHIDGYAAMGAHTLVVGASKDAPATGRKADVMQAAYLAGETALRLMKPGKKSNEVVDAINKVLAAHETKFLEGISIYLNKQNVLDGGDKFFTVSPGESQKKDANKVIEFQEYEAYNVEIIVSSGEGKIKQKDTRTTVFRRTEVSYMLKMKTARAIYSEIQKTFGAFAFSLRALEDETKAKMGIIECTSHGLVQPYDVLYEKDGEFIAQYKFTVLVMPNGPSQITATPYAAELVQSAHKVEDVELLALLSQSTNKKKAAKKKKAKKAGEAAAAGGDKADEDEGGDDGDEAETA